VEKVILAELCRIGGNLSRSSEVIKAVRTGININESTFNVSISRMVKKGLLTKGDGVLLVHPLFTGSSLEEYLVRFEDEKKD
jgi:predicted transcriptional regulator